MLYRNNRGFLATSVLYSLVMLLSMVLFIILRNSTIVRDNSVESGQVIKDSLLKYKVYYYGNSQTSGSIDMDTFYSGQYENLQDCNMFKRTGYTCIQYSTSVLNPNQTCIIDDKSCFHWSRPVYNIAYGGKSIGLYAVWKSNIYNINFDKAGGDGGTNGIYEKYDVGWYSDVAATHELSMIVVPTRRSYAFGGYYTGENGTGDMVVNSVGNIVAPANKFAEHKTLYAKWRLIAYTVTFNGNGGSVSPINKTVIYQTAYGTLPTPARAGYTFQGWYTQASGGSKIVSTSEVLITSNQTLYAQWKANTYNVIFNPNGGTVSPTSKTVIYNSTYGVLPTPVRSGYEFVGWYTQTSGGSQIVASTSVRITANQTLYARWQQKNTGGAVSVASRGGHTYAVFDAKNQGDWNNWRTFCSSRGGYLAIINDVAENNFLFDFMVGKGFRTAYFGLYTTNHRDWYWVDGTKDTLQLWGPGEPNNLDNREFYAMFFIETSNYRWNDSVGYYMPKWECGFICEWNY